MLQNQLDYSGSLLIISVCEFQNTRMEGTPISWQEKAMVAMALRR
jgi:hypothetical protein